MNYFMSSYALSGNCFSLIKITIQPDAIFFKTLTVPRLFFMSVYPRRLSFSPGVSIILTFFRPSELIQESGIFELLHYVV